MGRAKAAVLPVPVCAEPSTSPPREHDRDRLGLDGGGGHVAHFLHGVGQRVGEPERGEGGVHLGDVHRHGRLDVGRAGVVESLVDHRPLALGVGTAAAATAARAKAAAANRPARRRIGCDGLRRCGPWLSSLARVAVTGAMTVAWMLPLSRRLAFPRRLAFRIMLRAGGRRIVRAVAVRGVMGTVVLRLGGAVVPAARVGFPAMGTLAARIVRAAGAAFGRPGRAGVVGTGGGALGAGLGTLDGRVGMG